MDATRWSRWDQVSLEGLMYAVPGALALAVGVGAVRAVRGDAIEVTGPLPDVLVRPAEGVTGPLSGTVVLGAPTVGDQIVALLPLLLALVLVAAGARLLLGIARGLRDADPFTAANARRLRGLAALVLVGGLGWQVVDGYCHDALLSSLLPGVDRSSVFDISGWPAVVSVLLGFLAEVFTRGVRLREDVDGLV